MQPTLNSPPSKSKAQLLGYRLLERFFRGWVFLAITILLVVWALPHTIAARNIALFTGAGAGIGWMLLIRPSLSWKAYWPSICLLLVPLWVLFHWYCISTLKDLQWQELTSTWLRTSAGVVLGSVAGIMISMQPRRILWIVLLIALLPMITFILYVHQIYLQHNWVLNALFYGAFKSKFAAAYFVLCQVLAGFSLIYYAIQGPSMRSRAWTLVFGIALVLTGIADFIAVRALNGILVSSLGVIFCLIALVYHNLIQAPGQNRSGAERAKIMAYGLLVIFIVSAGLYAFWAYDHRYEGKLTHLVGDIQIATQIDKNQTWVADGSQMPDPIDSSGRPINVSTYWRISWFIKGIQFIQENPLGNGISHMAFGHYMRALYPNSKVIMTHSAWIDYTLGLGVPGLLLMWLAIWGVIRRSFCYQSPSIIGNLPIAIDQISFKQLVPSIAIWLVIGVFCFWFIGEVSEREYIEHYFFLIALFGMGVAPLFPSKDFIEEHVSCSPDLSFKEFDVDKT